MQQQQEILQLSTNMFNASVLCGRLHQLSLCVPFYLSVSVPVSCSCTWDNQQLTTALLLLHHSSHPGSTDEISTSGFNCLGERQQHTCEAAVNLK
jgi:hypothetical protein